MVCFQISVCTPIFARIWSLIVTIEAKPHTRCVPHFTIGHFCYYFLQIVTNGKKCLLFVAIDLLSHYDLGHQSYQQSRVWVGLVSDVMLIFPYCNGCRTSLFFVSLANSFFHGQSEGSLCFSSRLRKSSPCRCG